MNCGIAMPSRSSAMSGLICRNGERFAGEAMAERPAEPHAAVNSSAEPGAMSGRLGAYFFFSPVIAAGSSPCLRMIGYADFEVRNLISA